MRLAAGVVAVLAFAPLKAPSAGAAADLYAMRCASCHGERGQGSGIAPPLIGKSAANIHFMLDTGRMPAAVPYVGEIHREPQFTARQIAELVRYVEGFSPAPPDISLPTVMPGNAVRGRQLFAENCAQCHGAAGGGASVGSADVAPSLAGATVLQIAEAIRTGPSVMPRFGADVLSDQDVDDIVEYVNYAKAHANSAAGEDAGGFSLAHVGPVAEGFVAWVFGLGALVLFVRAVGTAGKEP